MSIDQERPDATPLYRKGYRSEFWLQPLRLRRRESVEAWQNRATQLDRGMAMIGWAPNQHKWVEVRPHEVSGYCHLTVISSSIAEGTTRGVPIRHADSVLRYFGCHAEEFLWQTVPCGASAINPWMDDFPHPVTKLRANDVYFIQAVHGGPIRIGCSDGSQAPLEPLDCGYPVTMRLLGVVRDGGPALEASIHRQFQASALHRGWFKATQELVEWIRANTTNA